MKLYFCLFLSLVFLLSSFFFSFFYSFLFYFFFPFFFFSLNLSTFSILEEEEVGRKEICIFHLCIFSTCLDAFPTSLWVSLPNIWDLYHVNFVSNTETSFQIPLITPALPWTEPDDIREFPGSLHTFSQMYMMTFVFSNI